MKKLISLLLCVALTLACAAALADGKVTPPVVETTEQTAAERTADVNGDGVEDVVTLLGTAFPESVYWEGLHMTVKDGATGETTDVALAESSGYDPQLWIGALTGEEKNDIFVSTESGGSGGYSYYSIFTFKDGAYAPIFDTESFNAENAYNVVYQDNELVAVTNVATGIRYFVSLAGRDADYLSGLYNEDGTLKTATEGDVYPLGTLYPVDIDNDGVYELVAVQDVCGLYHVDVLGNVLTVLEWNGESYTAAMTSLAVTGAQPAEASVPVTLPAPEGDEAQPVVTSESAETAEPVEEAAPVESAEPTENAEPTEGAEPAGEEAQPSVG